MQNDYYGKLTSEVGFLTDGKWRNTVYIVCKVCRYHKETDCGDFLLFPDRDGSLKLYPVSVIERIICCRLDQSECLMTMSNLIFQEWYAPYLTALRVPEQKCPLICWYHCQNSGS